MFCGAGRWRGERGGRGPVDLDRTGPISPLDQPDCEQLTPAVPPRTPQAAPRSPKPLTCQPKPLPRVHRRGHATALPSLRTPTRSHVRVYPQTPVFAGLFGRTRAATTNAWSLASHPTSAARRGGADVTGPAGSRERPPTQDLASRRHPPLRLLAITVRNSATRASSSIASPWKSCIDFAVRLLWPWLIRPVGSGTVGS